ncbi:MAG: acyltransferase family protein [bacterium]
MIYDRNKFGYIPELNGLRGVAIITVMLYHSELPFMQGGFIGVDIFFVLSGFLISTLLVQEFDNFQSISLKHFYMRRILRLMPALITFLLVFCLWSYAILNEEAARKNYMDSIISFAYLSNWARAFLIHPPDYLGHTWSLSIEEQFYFLWPLTLSVLLRVLKKRHHVALFTVGIALFSWFLRICLSILEISPERLYNGLDTRADALMIGCALGIVISSGLITEKVKGVLAKSLVVIAPLSAAGLLGFAVFSSWHDSNMYYWGFVVVEIMTAFLILDIFFNPRSIIRKILAIKWLVWIGTISYGLYLWHYPIFRTMQSLNYNCLSVISIGSVIAIVIAADSYYFLEKPILKIKKRFTRAAPDNSIQPTSASLRSADMADG